MSWKIAPIGRGDDLLYSQAGTPSLDLRFAGNKNLSDFLTNTPLVDHQRSMSGSNLSAGTFINSSGLIETAKVNLEPYSEDGNQWSTALGGTLTLDNSVSPPFGINRFYKLAGNGTKASVSFANESTTSGVRTYSLFVNPGTARYVQLWNSGAGTACTANFDLISLTSSTADLSVTANIDSVGNGWYRISVCTNDASTAFVPPRINIANSLADGRNPDYTGSGYILLSGVQINPGSTATTYIPTTNAPSAAPRFDHDPTTGESLGLLVEESRTNLILDSEQVTSSNWARSNVSVTPNTTTAPNGTLTADSVSNIPSTFSWIRPNGSLNTSLTYTITFFAKPLTTNKLIVLEWQGGNYFDLSNPVSGVEEFADGWFKITLTKTNVSSGPAIYIGAYGPTSDNVTFALWGFQIEQGSFPTSYIPTPATFTSRSTTATYYDANGVIQTAGIDVARDDAYLPDENGVMRPAGLLLEAAKTNLVTRSQEFDSSPWVAQIVDTVITANANTAPDGTVTADQVSGGRIERYDISYASGVTYTFSIFVKGTSGQTVGIGKFVAGSDGDVVLSYATLNGTWQRLSYTFTSPITASGSRVVISGANDKMGTATNFLVWGAQLEATPYATSYIPTTTSTVTRAADVSSSSTVTRSADVAQITGANFSSWYNQSEGTVFADAICKGLTSSSVSFVGHLSDGNTNNYIDVLRYQPSSNSLIVTGGVVQSALNPALPLGVYRKSAHAYAPNNVSLAVDGATPLTDSSTTLPTVNQIKLGGDITSTRNLNGHISRLTYWPQRLPDATLQTITS